MVILATVVSSNGDEALPRICRSPSGSIRGRTEHGARTTRRGQAQAGGAIPPRAAGAQVGQVTGPIGCPSRKYAMGRSARPADVLS